MPCKSCLVLELQFDIQLKGQQNLSLMEKVVNYFKRRGLLISVKDDFFIIQESGVRELLIFAMIIWI